jgi:hypothetical protein
MQKKVNDLNGCNKRSFTVPNVAVAYVSINLLKQLLIFPVHPRES